MAPRTAAVIGSPIEHSLSPAILNAAFRAAGLDWAFEAFEVDEDEVPSFLARAVAEDFVGLSVTMPDKAAAAAAVDEVSPDAEALGAVNSVIFEGGRTIGANTDGGGFLDALTLEVPDFDVAGQSVVVLGAGGAARAVILALFRAGAGEIVVANRTEARAREAVALAPGVGRVDASAAAADARLVVNATSIGMGQGLGGPLPLAADLLRSGQVVVDLIYWPFVTPLLAEARRRGATTVNGLGMLVHQAARSFVLWSGQEAPVEAMTDAARSALERRA